MPEGQFTDSGGDEPAGPREVALAATGLRVILVQKNVRSLRIAAGISCEEADALREAALHADLQIVRAHIAHWRIGLRQGRFPGRGAATGSCISCGWRRTPAC